MSRLEDEIARAEARIAELEKANAEAPGWGAAVGARFEEIKELKFYLASLKAGTAKSQFRVPSSPSDLYWLQKRAEEAEAKVLRLETAMRKIATLAGEKR